MTGIIAGVSVSQADASTAQLERAAAPSQREAVDALLAEPGVEEAFVLQTCNRVEGYAVADDAERARQALSWLTDPVPDAVVVEMTHEESLRHLLRVAAGLESLVLGEDQILGQMRDAYEDARGVGGIGPILEDGVTKALHVGERARTETAINEGALSLGSAAVRLAARERDLAGATGLVVGAGEMGTLAAKALGERVADLLVANRTVPHAEHVADQAPVEARAVGLDALQGALAEADVVVSATGSDEPVIGREALAGAGETFLVDIAQPHDVAVPARELPDAEVNGIEALESVTDETRARREEAADRVAGIVDREFDNLLAQYKRKRADRVISAMYESAHGIKSRELETALGKLDLDEDGEAVVESMADAIVSQLLAAPTASLRDAAEDDDWSTIHTALELFDPNFGPEDEEPPAFVTDMNPDDIPEHMREQMPPGVLEGIED